MTEDKCSFCGKELKKRVEDFKVPQINVKTGKPIVVKDVFDYVCVDYPECDYGYLPYEEEKRIDKQIERESQHSLTSEQLEMLRKRLGFKSKFKSALFLRLDEKAFTRWKSPKSIENINKSTELLIRLASLSKENINFINKLHETNFKFEPEDYKQEEK